jgi:hypothetical protein
VTTQPSRNSALRSGGQETIKRDGSSGTWLVRYAGDLWLAELRYYGFADSEPPAEPPAMPDEG